MRTRCTWVFVVVALVVGCSSPGPTPSPGPEPEVDDVATWSEAEDTEAEWIEDAKPIETEILAGDAEREAWLEDVPGDAGAGDSFDPLREVDLDENVIVVGGYPRCTEHSVVTVSGDGEKVAFEVHDDGVEDCDWAPYTIDAWSVPLELTDGRVPELE